MSKTIWKKPFTLEAINDINSNCMPGHVGIDFIEKGDDYLVAKMPVVPHNHQPMGLLHGGASVVLAETLGSVAALLCIEGDDKSAVGVEINANHLRAARKGWVYGTVKPVRIGRQLQVWNIEIRDEKEHLTCVSRLTTMTVGL
ncbi:MAG: hotdog fold thioesterase [Bacteroidota bacterium]